MTSLEVLPAPFAEPANGRQLIPLERTLALSIDAMRFAEVIASTQFVPAGLRGKPDAILAAIMYGAELGLGPMQALSKIAVIDGRPSLSAEAQRGLIRAAGHRIWTVELTNTRCTLAGQRHGDDRSEEVSWTMDDAKRAGLSGKSNWRAYPRQMLLARATADLARLLFSDVLGGFPATEDLLEETGTGATPTATVSKSAEIASAPTRRRRRARAPEAAPEDPPESAAAASSPTPQPPEPTKPEPDPDPPDGGDAALLEAERAATEQAAEQKLHEDLEASAEAAAAEPELITSEQRKKMQALFRERDVTDRDARLAYVSTVARRKVASSNDLTIGEASLVIDALDQWDPSDPDSKPFPPYDPATAPFPEGY